MGIGCLMPIWPKGEQHHLTFTLSSAYVKMPDDVQLAVDIFLPLSPSGPSTGQQCFPTVLNFTRYNRNWEFAPTPALACSLVTGGCLCGKLSRALFMEGGLPGTRGSHWNMRSVKYTREFLPAGYAWVTVDVRGTRASEGTRPIDLHSMEVEDSRHMAQWTLQQPWCDGRLYSTGISYDSMSALALASHGLPSVRASGLRCNGFTKAYGKFVHHLERNAPEKAGFPPVEDFLLRLFVNGVRHVDNSTPAGRKTHAHTEAIMQHANNWDMLATQRLILNRDDPGGPVQSIDEISVHTRIRAIWRQYYGTFERLGMV